GGGRRLSWVSSVPRDSTPQDGSFALRSVSSKEVLRQGLVRMGVFPTRPLRRSSHYPDLFPERAECVFRAGKKGHSSRRQENVLYSPGIEFTIRSTLPLPLPQAWLLRTVSQSVQRYGVRVWHAT
ncbi:hypothetical protein BHE74_00053377, partial [Ensete ventricosum]